MENREPPERHEFFGIYKPATLRRSTYFREVNALIKKDINLLLCALGIITPQYDAEVIDHETARDDVRTFFNDNKRHPIDALHDLILHLLSESPHRVKRLDDAGMGTDSFVAQPSPSLVGRIANEISLEVWDAIYASRGRGNWLNYQQFAATGDSAFKETGDLLVSVHTSHYYPQENEHLSQVMWLNVSFF